MKIVRFSDAKKQIHYGIQTGDRIEEIDGDILSNWKPSNRKHNASDVDLLAPINPTQLVCIGLNYHDHAKEAGFKIPAEPLIFLKGINSTAGNNDNIVLPRVAPEQVDFEAELLIVISKNAKC
ncbi:MAG: Rv2993c-like domain-containing protein, partial [Pseudomonadota bacterium]